MRGGWTEAPLSALLAEPLLNGVSPATEGRVAGRVLTLSAITQGIYAPSAVKDALFDAKVPQEKHVRPCDLLICRGNGNKELVGVAAFIEHAEDDTVFPDTMIAARVDLQKIAPRYLHLVWNSPVMRPKIMAVARTTNGIYKVNQENLGKLVVTFPRSIDEQYRIVNLLAKADTIRRKRREALALTDELVRSTFLEMFGDPVTNPRGWPVEALGTHITITPGWSANGDPRAAGNGEQGVLKISAVTSGVFLPEENKVVAEDEVGDRALVTPVRGDLLFSRANTRELVAAVCIVEDDHPNLFLPDKLWRITPSNDRVSNEYLRYLLAHPRVHDLIAGTATGSSGSMLNISQEKLRMVRVPVPPLDRQERFKRFMWEGYATRKQHRRGADASDALFASLQQRAFKGEL